MNTYKQTTEQELIDFHVNQILREVMKGQTFGLASLQWLVNNSNNKDTREFFKKVDDVLKGLIK